MGEKLGPPTPESSLQDFGSCNYLRQKSSTDFGVDSTRLAHAVVITGGIACGKSSVCQILQKRGFSVVCADKIAHAVLEECADELARAFGERVLAHKKPAQNPSCGDFGEVGYHTKDSGRIDRGALGEIVFSSATKRKLLESITHPRIYEEILRQARMLESSMESKDSGLDSLGSGESVGWYFLDIPLFFEGGARYDVYHVVCVSAPESLQIARLQSRNSLSYEQARARIAAQMPLAEKIARSTYVIENNGTIEELEQRVKAMLKSLESRLSLVRNV
ncbi:dephospho-CoA kinase [uncultured Helicobacter sp.]|uniref:dephospho-CoA kinase n=1 Tax=uncultured Helicobacter sp. TaxID=175537 RepID=UPI0026320559|nr:dephospho-CoA kinase [uncultured Helicobacter sp.]